MNVGVLIEHCGGSVEAALDMYLNDQARCREVAPPKVRGGKPGDRVDVSRPRGRAREVDHENGHQHVVHELMSERPLAPPSAEPVTLTQAALVERVGRDWIPNVAAAKALVELVVAATPR